MNELFLDFLRTSLVVGILTVVLALAAPLWNKTFAAAWKRRLWCLLVLVLLLGAFLRLPEGLPRVMVTVPAQQVVLAAQPGGVPIQLVDPQTLPATPVRPTAPGGTTPAPALRLPGIDLLTALQGLWLTGAAAFFLWQLLGGALVSRRVRRWGHAPENAALQEIYAQLCAEMAHPAPGLLICSGVGSPQLRGLFRPQLLLPTEAYSPVEASYILRHELTHWRCHDLFWKALTLLANALHWFNPAVWLLRREASRDMERACDECVCGGATSQARRAYGEVLLASLHKGRQSGLSTYFYGGKTVMKERLLNILSTENRRRGAVLTLFCISLTVLAISLVACTQPTAPVKTPQPGDYSRSFSMPLGAELYSPIRQGSMEPDSANADTMGKLLVSHDLTDGTKVLCYWDPSGEYKYWALRQGDRLTRFSKEENTYENGYQAQDYQDLFGHDGFRIESPQGAEDHAVDYYYLEESGRPVLLADCSKGVLEQDLNNDGAKELLWVDPSFEIYYYFQRDGAVYMANINAGLQAIQPDWKIEGAQPDSMAGSLLPIHYQTLPDGPQLEGAIGFGWESLAFYEKADPNRARPDAAINAIAQAHIQAAIADAEQRFEIGDDLSGESFFSKTHIQVLDSRQNSLEQVVFLPAVDGSGQVELWSLAYQLKLNHPDKIPLAGGATLLDDWLTIGPEGDSYNQPLFAIWRDAKGACTLLKKTIEGSAVESYRGSYEFYAAELLYAQTGQRVETLTFEVFTDPDFVPKPYHLQQSPGQWSLYIPEGWVAQADVEYPPDPATATRTCVGLWHDPADKQVALLLYHVDGRSDDPKLNLNLLHAAAADRGAGEINAVFEGAANLETISGIVQQHSAMTTQDVLFRTFVVDDDNGGAWAVVTSCPKEKRGLNEDNLNAAIITFRALSSTSAPQS